ncbi:hypothetical protein QFZ91_006382 [Paraburkholderia sp. JPY419]
MNALCIDGPRAGRPRRIAHQQIAVLPVECERERRIAVGQFAIEARKIFVAQRDRDRAEKPAVRVRAADRGREDVDLRQWAEHRQRVIRLRTHRLRGEKIVALAGLQRRRRIREARYEQLAVHAEQRDRCDLRKVAADALQALVQFALARTDLRIVGIAEQLDHARGHLPVQIQHLDGLLLRHAREAVDHIVRIGDPALVVEVAIAREAGQRKHDRHGQHDQQHAPCRREVA